VKLLSQDHDELIVQMTRAEFITVADLATLPHNAKELNFSVNWIYNMRRRVERGRALVNAMVDFLNDRSTSLLAGPDLPKSEA
jgi:hypothetical protein